jgi:hypothetical protein
LQLNATQGDFEEFSILDGSGDEIGTPVLSPTNVRSINFTLDYDVDDAFLVAQTRNANASISYDVANATKSGVSSAALQSRQLLLGMSGIVLSSFLLAVL